MNSPPATGGAISERPDSAGKLPGSLNRSLHELAEQLARWPELARLGEMLRAGTPREGVIDGVWGAACGLVAAALGQKVPGSILIVAPTAEQAEELLEDLSLFTVESAALFPAQERSATEVDLRDELFGQRLRVLKALSAGESPRFLVTSIMALMQPIPGVAELAAATRLLRVGDLLGVDQFCQWLAERGFVATPGVQLPGEYARRGCLVDVFPPDSAQALRIELFDEWIESLRWFDVATQRSITQAREVGLTAIVPAVPLQGAFLDYLAPTTVILLVEPAQLLAEARQYLERLESPVGLFSAHAVFERVARFARVAVYGLAPAGSDLACRLPVQSVERLSGVMDRVAAELDEIVAEDEVYLVCETEAEVARLGDLFASTRLSGFIASGKLHWVVGKLSRGFRLPPQRICVLSASELFSRQDLRRPPRRPLAQVIDSFLDLREGDLVVHVAHGIARYRGTTLLEKQGALEDHLILEFAERVRLYVPSSKIYLVQKYVGGAKSRPHLAKLGSRRWARQKRLVEQAVSDLAAELLEIQAARNTLPGIAFPPDSQWQQLFDASFPYQETEDQLVAIEAVKQDMIRPRPMDRLLCGDVGFGKTEVAMRACFKAVEAGYQVAVLVPTTVLAEQHYRTFLSRMAAFPIRVAMLSRFVSPKEQKPLLEDLADGRIDIIIGTHRLLSGDVRFHNLGLVIIDEEQRFGVQMKERFKALRHSVDVLTMTATPIPRTLHMALLGLRDISNLEAPIQDRLAVETYVGRFDPALIRHAILRELSRQGQIFFVHNRVKDIEDMACLLQRIVPEARLRIGHGQMPEDQLEKVMIDFVRHRFDLLLCTTIIENGLDIPNANTIFINEADRFGLADLHQLRGRVGRYKHRAYCYLLVDPNKVVTPNAQRRLRAIEEYCQLGAGFALAVRDLEIRGAGNILGPQQSGHIAMVGYELYCQLLEQAVRRLKRLPPKEVIEVEINLPCAAYFPNQYVPDFRAKIDLYRRLVRVNTREELDGFRAELRDRFGPLPPEAENLLELAELRLAASRWAIRSIRLEDKDVVFNYMILGLMDKLRRISRGRLRIVDNRSAYLAIVSDRNQPERLIRELKSLLQCA